MIARNEEEFEKFQKMDQERYIRENKTERLKEIRERKPHLANVADEKINYRLI